MSTSLFFFMWWHYTLVSKERYCSYSFDTNKIIKWCFFFLLISDNAVFQELLVALQYFKLSNTVTHYSQPAVSCLISGKTCKTDLECEFHLNIFCSQSCSRGIEIYFSCVHCIGLQREVQKIYFYRQLKTKGQLRLDTLF